MQPVHAQTPQHGSTESHSGSTTTAPSGSEQGMQSQGTEAKGNESHAAQSSEHQPSKPDGHSSTGSGASHDGLKSEGHDATQGHAPASHEGATHANEPLKTEPHPVGDHVPAQGDGHGGDAAHGDGHGTGHAYHPPAPYVVDVGGFTVHANTLIATYLVMAILIVMAIVATRNLAKKPGKVQIFFESLVDLPHYIVKSQITHHTSRYVPLIGTIFLFILFANWMGLFPWRIIELFGTPKGFEVASPTNDLNTNFAIAATAVASYWFFGIQKKGLSHFKHYFQPMWFLFPLNMMEDVSRPLSLSFRLFGNILGGEIVIGILLFLTSAYVVTSVVVLPMFALEVLVGFIQAFIFSMLTASYIGGMVAEHH
ncbi:MAG: ATP synthase F0 subunit A [Candidatus Melainabacteria bacterium HGW-Melainabacteria-1]|nr:MAG: ATP synthase F0 subunit A [Candidatus Melainabacteria bacterium HGW-Melainabacteria-1]